MDISRRGSRLRSVGLATTKQLEASLDVRVAGIQFSSPLVSIQSIICLVVARLILRERVRLLMHNGGGLYDPFGGGGGGATYQSTEIIPNF